MLALPELRRLMRRVGVLPAFQRVHGQLAASFGAMAAALQPPHSSCCRWVRCYLCFVSVFCFSLSQMCTKRRTPDVMTTRPCLRHPCSASSDMRLPTAFYPCCFGTVQAQRRFCGAAAAGAGGRCSRDGARAGGGSARLHRRLLAPGAAQSPGRRPRHAWPRAAREVYPSSYHLYGIRIRSLATTGFWLLSLACLGVCLLLWFEHLYQPLNGSASCIPSMQAGFVRIAVLQQLHRPVLALLSADTRLAVPDDSQQLAAGGGFGSRGGCGHIGGGGYGR